MKTLLWLDDYRNPLVDDWLVFSPIDRTSLRVIWVKGYDEFVDWITKKGLPDAICFDHDLNDFKDGIERTGKDCANFLVDYCLDHNLQVPLFNIQSSNPAGADNIRGLLNSYNKYFNESKN